MSDLDGDFKLDGRADDPEFVATCLRTLFRENHVVQETCTIMMGALSGMLGAIDGLSDESKTRFVGPCRQVIRDATRAAEERIGTHKLLKALDEACGLEPLKLVVTNPIDPAA